MPPRRTRAAKKAEEHEHKHSTEDAQTGGSSSTTLNDASEPPKQGLEASTSTNTPTADASKSKGKARAARHQPLLAETPATEAAPAPAPDDETQVETSHVNQDEGETGTATPDDVEEGPSSSSALKPSMEERQARLAALRAKMAASTRANRKDILSEQSRARSVASELRKPSASRKLQKAEKVLEERDLREAGEDVERHRNMHYSLEDSERWDAKLEEKERRKDQGPADFGDAAERAYQRQLRLLKPDVQGYKKRRDQDEALKASSPASAALTVRGKAKTRGTGELQTYTSADDDAFHYGTHKPSDDAIDRVVNHLNHERQVIQNRSRRRHDDPDADVNYINDSNRHFNKKLKRYYDKQTQEIRENRKCPLFCTRSTNCWMKN